MDAIVQISIATALSLVGALIAGTTWILRLKHTQETILKRIDVQDENTKELQKDASRKLSAQADSIASLERWRERMIGAAQARSGKRAGESTTSLSRRSSERDSDGDIPIV